MRIAIRTGLGILALGALAQPAAAEMTVYYHAGSWDAFSGQDAEGKLACGVGSTNPTDNRKFSMRFVIGGDSVTFQAKKPTWSIPEGTQLPVVVQIGLDTPWTMQGTGKDQVVEWTLDRGSIQAFDTQFRRALSMTVTFPSGNEPPWTVGLNGSTAISNAMGRCVTDLTARAGTQPQGPTPAGPTQPFSPATAPTQGPTQPAKQP